MKWKYHTISHALHDTTFDEVAALDAAGEEGWELVSVTVERRPGGYYRAYFFKQLAEEEVFAPFNNPLRRR